MALTPEEQARYDELRLQQLRAMKAASAGQTRTDEAEKPFMEKAAGWIKSSPEDAWAMMKNAPGDAVNVVGDTVEAIMHPVETGKTLLKLARGVAKKGARKWGEFALGGPLTPSPDEQIADNVGQYYKDRYGSIDAIRNTLINEPVSAALDVSAASVLPRALGLANVAKGMAAVDPVNIATNTAKGIARMAIPEDTAVRLYESAAKFSPSLSLEKRRQLSQTALDNSIMPTRQGAGKLEGLANVLMTDLDNMIAGATRSNVQIPVNAVFMYFKELRQGKGGVRIDAEADLDQINKIAKKFSDRVQGRQFITPEELQIFKRDLYSKIYEPKMGNRKKATRADTYSALARGAKDAVSSRLPEVEAINDRLGDLLDLKRQLPKSIGRIENENFIPYRSSLVGGVAGMVSGSPTVGIAAGTLAALMGNPTSKARIGIAINKIKSGDVGWAQNNLTATELRAAMMLAAGNENFEEQEKE